MTGSGTLVGVGVGPGDPALITVKGRDALVAADALFVPVAATSSDEEPGYAERVVAAHVPHATPITRLAFHLEGAARDASWRDAAEQVAAVLRDGRTAAFATIGDPNVYSTFTHLAREVVRRCPDATVETVPGITAMQDLAARSATVLVERDETLTLLPLASGVDRLRAALDGADTVVLYKGGRHLSAVRAALADAGRLDQAVFGARLGLAGEDIRGSLPDAVSPYLSTVIVPPVRKETS